MSEFKFCSFKRFLPKALRLNIEFEDVVKFNEKRKNSNEYEKISNKAKDKYFYDVHGKENNIEEAVIDIKEPITDKKLIDEQIIDTNFEKLVLNENKNLQDKNSNSINYEENSEIMDAQMIDFPKFCNILKIFNSSFPVDLKIKCKNLFLNNYLSLFQII